MSDIQEADKALAEILSIAGHELAQPLAVALGCARLITRPPENMDAGQRQQILDTLTRSLSQLTSLIHDLELTGSADLLGEVNEKELAGRREPATMAFLLEKAIEDFGFSHPRCHIELATKGDLRVKLDLSRFRQVLSNLLSNAEKFSTPGTSIHVESHREAASVIVSVTNEGRGFPPEEANRIFERSVRLDEVMAGKGWGLYVARAIVEAHGGELWAEGDTDKGATFFIRIPAANNRNHVD